MGHDNCHNSLLQSRHTQRDSWNRGASKRALFCDGVTACCGLWQGARRAIIVLSLTQIPYLFPTPGRRKSLLKLKAQPLVLFFLPALHASVKVPPRPTSLQSDPWRSANRARARKRLRDTPGSPERTGRQSNGEVAFDNQGRTGCGSRAPDDSHLSWHAFTNET